MIKKKHLFLLFLTAALTVLTAQAQEKIFSEAEAMKALENWEQKLFEEEMCSHMKDDWLDQFFLNDELENDGLISGKCPFSLLQLGIRPGWQLHDSKTFIAGVSFGLISQNIKSGCTGICGTMTVQKIHWNCAAAVSGLMSMIEQNNYAIAAGGIGQVVVKNNYGIAVGGLIQSGELDNKNYGVAAGGLFQQTGNNCGIAAGGVIQVVQKNNYGITAGGVIQMVQKNNYGIAASPVQMSENNYGFAVGGLLQKNGENNYGIIMSGLIQLGDGGKNHGIATGIVQLNSDRENHGISCGLIQIRPRGNNHGISTGVLLQYSDRNAGTDFGLCNITTENTGLQIGVLNTASEADEKENSCQIGLINITGGKGKVVQFGLFNYAKDGILPFTLFVNFPKYNKK